GQRVIGRELQIGFHPCGEIACRGPAILPVRLFERLAALAHFVRRQKIRNGDHHRRGAPSFFVASIYRHALRGTSSTMPHDELDRHPFTEKPRLSPAGAFRISSPQTSEVEARGEDEGPGIAK